ncbi:MAG: hypothetical protein U5L09_18805 [Bacteroidales bacterium]|nr:hypothetical protein [Bacteroidales bacterium]
MNTTAQPYDDNYWKIAAWKSAIRLTVDIEQVFSTFSDHIISRDLIKISLNLSSHISLGFEERNHGRSVWWLCTRHGSVHHYSLPPLSGRRNDGG